MSTNYISAQPHINKIREALWDGVAYGRASLMIGSGFSLNARSEGLPQSTLPTWKDLMLQMIKELSVLDHDLSELEIAAQSKSGALRIAQEYEALHGRAHLDAFLLDRVPERQFHPGALHTQALTLPWSDIFTTNWDTLLERAASQLLEYRYHVVVQTSDIARRRRPRIVKLHGTFPSNDPFIVTEEDFRTYPQQFASFVNLVQQSIMENVLCLIGFSGDDPNFLSWSGWVRDNLKKHRPRIYLCGVLSLRDGQKKMLKDRGVIPIDLSVLFANKPRVLENRKAEIALQWFFANLRAGQPPNLLSWPEPPDPPTAGPSGFPPIPPYSGKLPRKERVFPGEEG